MNAIEARGISKAFGTVKALSGVCLDVGEGEIYGLLGPDGAGKTTLFRVLTTLILPDSGSASVCGYDIIRDYRRIRAVAGYMPGRFSLYPDLSVEENLKFYAALFGVSVSDNFDMIEPIYARLAPFAKRRAANLSGGMKQKLALCCALIHSPKILFLDEPTTGVDAVSRSEFWDMLGNIRSATGMPVVVSTPYMDEASRCDRVSLMYEGRVLETGTPADILRRNRMPLLAVRGKSNYRALLAVRRVPGVNEAFLSGEYIHAFVEAGFDLSQLSRLQDVEEVRAIEPDMEDVFIKTMGNGKR